MKSKLFVLKNEMLTSLTINSIFSKLIIFQISLTINHCFMSLNHFSWFFQIRMKTKRRFDIKSFMIKIFENELIKHVWKKIKKNQFDLNVMWILFTVVCDSTRWWSIFANFCCCRFAFWVSWSSDLSIKWKFTC